MSILDHINKKLTELGHTLELVTIGREGERVVAVVLARRGDETYTTWLAGMSSNDEWLGLSHGHYDMTCEEAREDYTKRCRRWLKWPAKPPALFANKRGGELATRLLDAAPADLKSITESAGVDAANRAWELLDGIVAVAALAAAYVETRCAGRDHEAGVKNANFAHKAAREALGYSATPHINF